MRGFFTFLLFLVFTLIFPITIFSIVANNFFKPDYIKNKIEVSGIYQTASKLLPELILREDGENLPEEGARDKVKQILIDEMSPGFMKEKTEGVIDQGFDWLSGNKTTPLTIDLTDLKKKIEVATVEEELFLELGDDLNKPVELKISPELEKRKKYLQGFRKSPVPLVALSAVLLLGVFLLAKGWKSKFRKLSLALFLPSLLGLIILFASFFLLDVITNLAMDNLKGSDFNQLGTKVGEIVRSINRDVISSSVAFYAGAIILSAVLFLVSFFIRSGALSQKPEISHIGNGANK